MSSPASARAPQAGPNVSAPVIAGPGVVGGNGGTQRRARHQQFHRLYDDNYDQLRSEVLVTVGGKLAARRLYLDPRELKACYNQAWHGLYVMFVDRGVRPEKLCGLLVVIAFRRAIEEARRAKRDQGVLVSAEDHTAVDDGYEIDLADDVGGRATFRQWLIAAQMGLTEREWQAVCLCDLHEYPRREAAEIMAVTVKRLDKIITKAHRKLGPLTEAVLSGRWCVEHRSLMKAFALGLHNPEGKRYRYALGHIVDCQGCAAYVRSVRGLTAITPLPVMWLGAGAAAGGGIAGSTLGVLKGSGAAAGTAGTASAGAVGTSGLLGGIGGTALGGKAAVVCIAMVCVGGGGIAIRDSADHPKPRPAKRHRAQSPPPAPPPPPPSPAPSPPAAPPTPAAPKRKPIKNVPTLRARPIPAQSAPPMGPESGGDPSAPPKPAPSNGTLTFGP